MESEEHQNQTAKELELASARESAVMALFGICFSSSNHRPLMQIQRNIHFANTHIPKAENADKSSPCSSISKRSLNLSVVTFILCVPLPAIPTAMAEQELELQRYTDLREGFTLLIPSSYVKVDKAGATVLFEEMLRRTNSVGVVVNPVRLMSLRDFGSPQFVADRLIQAEKRKESTKKVELIGAAERFGTGDLLVYEFEYKVDSTRGGMKTIFSAAFVSEKKLYLLNISHADERASPLDSSTRLALEQVLHSFDATSLT